MWRLNPFDDYPFHQAISPIDVPATSDRHFNDGYWFSFYAEGIYAFAGLRVHPNNNVMDGYAGAVYAGEQRNVRFSRALRPNTNETAVGPFRLEIVEPLKVQRLTLGPNETGIEYDVHVHVRGLWPETQHRQYRHGVVLNDLLRYVGVVRVSGWISVDGKRIEVDDWYGARDHSWGIRSTMGPRTPLGGVDSGGRDPRALRLWIPFECGSLHGFFHMHEDAAGNLLDFEGELRDGDTSIELGGARHALRYEPGSRRVKSGDFTLIDREGKEYDFTFDVCCEPVDPQGFGYTRGWSDGMNPGVWRGPDVIESSRFDVRNPNEALGGSHLPLERRIGGTEFAATLSGPDGAKGMGMVEHMIYGTYKPYGFEGPNPWST